MVPSPALVTPLPANKFPNNIAPNVPSNILRNPTFCYFVPFSFVSVAPFVNNPDSSTVLTNFMMSSIFSLEIINVVFPDPRMFLWISFVCC